jgi:ATP-dependent DNA helicase RecG
MPKTDLEESQNIELKRQFKDGIVNTVVSFANTDGGEIYLGIDKTKEVVGVNITPELKDKIQQVCNEIEDPISVTTEAKSFSGKDEKHE